MTTSPRAVLTCWKRLSSSSMCAAGSCEKAPPRRLPSENAPAIIARAIGELSLSVPAAATWSQVARMSRTSSSTASRSTSVIALVRTTFCFCRLRAWRASAVEVVADRRHGVARGDRRDVASRQGNRFSDFDLLVAQKWRLGGRDLAEIGPDRPVEKMVAHDLDRGALGIDRERLGPHAAHRVDEERNRGHVVEVRVRDEDVVDQRELGERQVADAGAGVDQNVAVEKKGGGAQVPPADPSRAAEHSQSHALLLISRRTPSRRPSRAAAVGGASPLLFAHTPGRARRRDSCAAG